MSFSRFIRSCTVTLCTATLTVACSGPEATDSEANARRRRRIRPRLAKQVVAEFLSVPVTDVTIVSAQEKGVQRFQPWLPGAGNVLPASFDLGAPGHRRG